jgi:hypothetical protein
MSMYSDYVSRMDTQLKLWDAKVATLMAETAQAQIRTDATQDGWKENLRASRDSARKTFREISVANEAATLEMKAAMETAWGSMQSALADSSYEYAACELASPPLIAGSDAGSGRKRGHRAFSS